MLSFSLLFALFLGCNDSSPQSSKEEKLDLQTVEKSLLVNLGKWQEFDRILDSIRKPQERDILLLSISVDKPAYAAELCKRVVTQNAQEKCRQVLARPHLSSPG